MKMTARFSCLFLGVSILALILGSLFNTTLAQAVAPNSLTGSMAVNIFPDDVPDLGAEWRLASKSGNRATATVPAGGNWWVWLKVVGDTPGTAWARCYINGQVVAERTVEAAHGVEYCTFGVGPAFPSGTELAIAVSDGQLNLGSQIIVMNAATAEVLVLVEVTIEPIGPHGLAPKSYSYSLPSVWYRSGQVVSGIPVGAYTIEFKEVLGWVTPPSQTVTIRAGQTTIVNAIYTLAPLQPVRIISPPSSQSVIRGSAVSFSVVAQGSAPLAYQWLRDGVFLVNNNHFQGADTLSLHISAVQPQDAGDYQVMVSNSLGSITSVIAVLTVRPPPLELLWQFQTESPLSAIPAIGTDRTIYVGSARKVYAIDADTRSKKWDFSAEGDVTFLAVGEDGTVFAAASGVALYALDKATGGEKWRFPRIRLLTIGIDGTVYALGNANQVFAMDDRTGAQKWAFTLSSDPHGAYDRILVYPASLVIGADGTVYTSSHYDVMRDRTRIDSYLDISSLDRLSGKVKWSKETTLAASSYLLFGSDGTLYSNSGGIALDSITGERKWLTGRGRSFDTSVVGADGTLYIAVDRTDYSETAVVRAVDGATGQNKWDLSTESSEVALAIATDGTLYIVGGNYIFLFDTNTKQEKYRWTSAGSLMCPVMSSDGILYVASGNVLYAIQGECPPASSAWPMFGHDARHTGRASPKGLLWIYQTGGRIDRSPAIGTDGTVYVGSDDKKLYALNGVTGAKKWEFLTGGPARSPAIGADGIIYVGSLDSKVYVLRPGAGNKKWEFLTDGSGCSCCGIGVDGTVYVSSGKQTVYALNGAIGGKKWQSETRGWVQGLGADGTVYLWGNTGTYALDGATGIKKWESPFNGNVAIGADGTVYVWDLGGLCALNGATGALKWQSRVIAGGIPAIGADGTVYTYRIGGRTTALDGSTGSEKWHCSLGGESSVCPAITADSTVYVCGTPSGYIANTVYGLDGVSGAREREFAIQGEISTSPVIGPDGTVYICSSDGVVYAWLGGQPLANSPWPMECKDARHTASAELAAGPIVILTQPESRTVPAGSHVELGIMAGGNRPLAWQWLNDGVPLTDGGRFRGTTGACLAIAPVQPSDAGNYQVVVSNSYGAVTSVVANITVRLPELGECFWDVGFQYGFPSSLAIGLDGTVYVAVPNNPTGCSTICALQGASGANRWEFTISGYVSDPSVGADGSVYVGSDEGKVYALDGVTGAKRWEFTTVGGVFCSPAIGVDETVYVTAIDFSTGGGSVYALQGASGAKRWECNIDGGVYFSPAIGLDGTVFVESGDQKVYALNGATGAKRWEFNTDGGVDSSLSIGADGTLYVVSEDHEVWALDRATGTRRWEFTTGGNAHWPPAIGADGTVYVGSGDREVYALDGVSGGKRWEFTTDGTVYSSPAIGADGTVYIGPADQKVYALDGVTGAKRWEFNTHCSSSDSCPVIGANGIVYVAAGRIYALYGGTPPANSPWPMWGHDAQHASRAGLSTAVRINLEYRSGKLTLHWSGDFMLQTANSVQGPWVDLAGASSGDTHLRLGVCRFFRLRSK
jgi:outer membrane protein assembly factor BamB